MNITSWRVALGTVSIRKLFSWCIREHKVDRLLVAVRMEKQQRRWRCLTPGDLPERVEALFHGHIREQFLALEWPGSRTGYGQAGLVFIIEFNSAVMDLMLSLDQDLRNWNQGRDEPLPEDVCLFNTKDSHPIFLSVTHEELAWLLTHKKPRLKGVSIGNVFPENPSQDCYFIKAPYFCYRLEEKARGRNRVLMWSRGRWHWEPACVADKAKLSGL